MLHINLILDFPGLGVFLGRNGSAPGNEIWHLPDDLAADLDAVDAAVTRITRNLLGMDLDPTTRHLVAAYMDTSHHPQPSQHLSICYALPCNAKVFKTTSYQFTAACFVATTADIPTSTGNMCRCFLEEYLDHGEAKRRVGRALALKGDRFIIDVIRSPC